MTDLFEGLLGQMSSKFNESTSNESLKNLDFQETDKTLKWKTLINNTYAKKDRRNKNRNTNKITDGEESIDDKSLIVKDLTSQTINNLPAIATITIMNPSTSIKIDQDSECGEKSEKNNLENVEKIFNTKEKIIAVSADDDCTNTTTITSVPVTITEYNDEKNIINLPQLNANGEQATIKTGIIESTTNITKTSPITAHTTATIATSSSTVTDKKSNTDDNKINNSKNVGSGAVTVGSTENDKKNLNSICNMSKVIDKTTSPRSLRLRSTRNTPATPTPSNTSINKHTMSDDKNKSDEMAIKSDVEENEPNNSDVVNTSDSAQPSLPKKQRGRPKIEVKVMTGENKIKEVDSSDQIVENESELTLKRGRGRLRKTSIIVEDKKPDTQTSEDVDIKKESDDTQEETPKRRGRSRKMIEDELKDKEDLKENPTESTDSSPKRKRGRISMKKTESDSVDDNNSEGKGESANDDAKPRLLMTIRTDKSSAIPKIITPTAATTPDDPEKNNIIKKRGRRPKLASNTTPQPIQTKKSLRLARDEGSNISEAAIIRKGKLQSEMPAPLGRVRSLRRIKPTAKILANEELRQGFEVQNCKRLSISNENLIDSYERSPTSNRHSNHELMPDKQTEPPHRSSNKEQIHTANLILEHMYSPKKPPCRDPQDFLNEIKSFKIGPKRLPEENKKLSRRQQKKLFKLKVEHFSMLGLRRARRDDDTSSSNPEDSDVEEFIPKSRLHKNPNIGKPSINLRLRNAQKQAEAMTAKRNVNLRRREQQVLPEKRIKLSVNQKPSKPHEEVEISDEDCIVVNNKENTNAHRVNLLCYCHQKAKYFVKHSPTLGIAIDGKIFCCALDEIEKRKIGCTNELTDPLISLYRPSVKVSYMVLCSSHKKRLISHNCCAGCGIFCTQGTFAICSNKHFFHRDCAMKYIMNTPYEQNNPHYTGPTLVLKCPHCGIDAPDFEYRVTMRCENLPVFVQHRNNVPKPAKMGIKQRQQHLQQQQHNSLLLNIEKLIPESVIQLLRSANDKLKAQRALPSSSSTSTPDSSKLFAPKDFFYAIYNKDGEDRIAEIVASGFSLLTPLKEFHNGTCLHLISNFGTLTMAYLILCRANSHNFINMFDKEMRTAAMCAVLGKRIDILKLLCQCGADVTIKGPEGMTVLHLSAKIGNFQATLAILEHYRQIATISKLEKFINTTDDGHWTALVWAAENGHTEIVNYLISLGADPNICDSENNTVVHWAALSGRLDSIYPLLSNSDLNIQNVHGDTALHIACRQSKTKLCLLLLANGAGLNIKNIANELPVDCILDQKNECARLLKLNMELRKIGIGGWKSSNGEKLILCTDISNGREVYPIQIVKDFSNGDDVILPDFKYITKNILLQNTIQIDQRISQMRICSCSDNCISENCQCGQISLQNWYNVDGRLITNFNFLDPPMLFECNDVCGCNRLLCKNRIVQNGIKLPLSVFECESKVKGFGVKCLSKIRKGTFVAQYTGEILTDNEADRRTDDSYFFDLGASDHCIDANFYGNVSRFFNHSCIPNIVPVRVYYDHQDLRFPKIAFFASRDIEVGEEIAFDYGEKFWMIKYKYFTCLCKTEKCRYSVDTIERTLEEFNQRNNVTNH